MADEAGVTHDVTLAGKGYNLVPGSYRRAQVARVGDRSSREGVYRQTAYTRRQRGAADGASIWLAEGFTQAEGGHALQILPAVAWDTSTAGAATAYSNGADFNSDQYLAADTTIYKVAKVTVGAPEAIGTYQGLTAVRTAAATVKQLLRHGDKLYATLGASYDRYDGATWTNVATAADYMVSHAGALVRATLARLFVSKDEVTWFEVPWSAGSFAGVITGMVVHDGAVYIGTSRGLWRFELRWTQANPSTAPLVFDLPVYDLRPLLPQEGVVSADNFKWMQSYGGRLYYWAGGSIWSYDGVSQRAEREPVYGTLLGMTVAGLFLVVSMRTGEDNNVLWLLDQALWTRLEQGSGAGDQYRAPLGSGSVKDSHLFCWADGTRFLARWNFSSTTRVFTSGHATPFVQLPEIDGGEPEVLKQWVELGIELGAVEGANALTLTPATWIVETSTDGGATWTARITQTPAALFASYSTALSGVSSRRLWVRVRCTGGGGNNPQLRSVWLRYRTGVSASSRRRWEFTARASDQVVQHTGARDSRTGRQIAQDLLALIGAGAVEYRDLTYQATGTPFTVQVVEVEERTDKNWEPRGGESGVRVVLEEVA